MVHRTVDEVLDVAAGVVVQRGLKRVRFLHILVGDGIKTNENAAKRLLRRYALEQAAMRRVDCR